MEFSFYDYSLQCAAKHSTVEDLGAVALISRRHFDERETFRFTTQVPSLEYISLLIENSILLRTNRGGRVYAGFERISRMEAIVARYLRIADVSERVYVFGVKDWTPPRHPNMKIIPVAADSPLSLEWFVIANSSNYRVALLAKDEDGFDTPVLEERTFSAIKTSNPAAVMELTEMAEKLIDKSSVA
jgi:DICT domain-containing protein